MLTYNPKAEHVVEFKEVYKAFWPKIILNGVSFTINKGEILAVIGPSGAGKSTILKLVSGLIEPDSGEVIVSSTKKGMAFQFGALLNFLNVKENIALPLRKKTQLSEDEINQKVKEALENVGLEGTEYLFPAELSGGMQKRVSFARAVVTNPDIILYDEPTSGLDPMTTTMIVNDICEIKKRISAASIVVTHDLKTIEQAADKIILLYSGNIVYKGTPQQLRDSNNPFAIQFANGYCEGPMIICSQHDKKVIKNEV